MDIISHGFYGGVVFGRKNRMNFLWAFLIGAAPDMLSFGLFWLANLLGLYQRPNWSHGAPSMESIPSFVSHLYNATHSLVIFLVVFLIIWAVRKKPFWLLGAWGLHILVDIPSHSFQFFPTPFLWPISDFKINGIQWGDPIIYFPNLAILAILYGWFLFSKMKKLKNEKKP
jgi:hypothetical protein